MAKKSSKCAVCENQFRVSICADCVNHRLNEYRILLDSLRSRREVLSSRLSDMLVIKGKVSDRQSWRSLQNEKLAKLREKLQYCVEQLQQRKTTVGRLSRDLKRRCDVIESANFTLEKNRVCQLDKRYPDIIGNCYLVYIEVTSDRLHKQALVMKQICKLFPLSRVTVDGNREHGCRGQYDQIYNALLPHGLNLLSVPPKELAASLGYMVQLLNLVVRTLAIPAIHNFGFGGSRSRIWQRDSYWNSRPSSQSNEYPLFIPSHNFWSINAQNSWTNSASSNFGVASVQSDRTPEPSSSGLDVFNYSSASPHSLEACRELQKGIALLKQSLAHITAYGYSSLCIEFPSASSTFELFARLLNTLSSFKAVQSTPSLSLLRFSKQGQQPNKSVWNLNSTSSTFLNSAHSQPTSCNNSYYNVPNTATSYLPELHDANKNESFIGGWDFVKHPGSPYGPMSINAKKS